MKIFAIALNVLLLLYVGYLLSQDGIPKGPTDRFSIGVAVLAPLSSIIALLRAKDESWLSLFFQRKALEEKKKIERLGDETKP